MERVLHDCATIRVPIRRAIERSQASLRTLALMLPFPSTVFASLGSV